MTLEEKIDSLPLNKLDKGSYYQVLCPFHNDTKPSAGILKENGFFTCFACGQKKSINQLYFHYFHKFPDNEEDHRIYQENKFFRKTIKAEPTKEELEARLNEIKIKFTGNQINPYLIPKVREYLDYRGITKDLVEKWDITFTEHALINGKLFQDKLLIPIYYKDKLISYEGRSLEKSILDDYKKVIYPPKSSVSVLFDYDNLDKTKPLFLVEGTMDTPKIIKLFGKNVTTPFGISLSNLQKKLLNEFPEIILIPDADEGGLAFHKIMGEFYTGVLRTVWLPQGLDPGACEEDVILDSYNNTFHKELKETVRRDIQDSGLIPKKNYSNSYFL